MRKDGLFMAFKGPNDHQTPQGFRGHDAPGSPPDIWGALPWRCSSLSSPSRTRCSILRILLLKTIITKISEAL